MQDQSDDDIPLGLELTALGESFRNDPYPMLARIREKSAAFYDPAPSRFFVTRNQDVRALLGDTDLFMDPRKANPGTFSKEVIVGSAGFGESPDMLFLDDPDHHRLRSLVSAAFRPKQIERWRDSVRKLIHQTLDAIDAEEFDLVERFAAPVPVAVIATMLGIAEEHFGKFKAWSDTVVLTGLNPFPTEEQRSPRENDSTIFCSTRSKIGPATPERISSAPCCAPRRRVKN